MSDFDRDREEEAEGERRRSPPDLRLRGDPPRVMRLSRKALAVMGTVAGVGIGGASATGNQRITEPGRSRPS